MHRDNQPKFDTKTQRVANFKNFTQNIEKEKEELSGIQKGFKKNSKSIGEQEHKLKWNKVTNKMDDVTKMEIDDMIQKLDEYDD